MQSFRLIVVCAALLGIYAASAHAEVNYEKSVKWPKPSKSPSPYPSKSPSPPPPEPPTEPPKPPPSPSPKKFKQCTPAGCLCAVDWPATIPPCCEGLECVYTGGGGVVGAPSYCVYPTCELTLFPTPSPFTK